MKIVWCSWHTTMFMYTDASLGTLITSEKRLFQSLETRLYIQNRVVNYLRRTVLLTWSGQLRVLTSVVFRISYWTLICAHSPEATRPTLNSFANKNGKLLCLVVQSSQLNGFWQVPLWNTNFKGVNSYAFNHFMFKNV